MSSGGRPSGALLFNPRAGVVLAADCGVTQIRAAVFDLGRNVLAEEATQLSVVAGPHPVLDWLVGTFKSLLAQADVSQSEVMAVGLRLPGPVDSASGRPVAPPIMPGWDDFVPA